MDLRDFDDTPDRVRVDPKTVPFTPHDNTRAIRLRQDPSVVSLLNMYDDKGHIKSDAFTNSPQTPTPLQEIQGRDQKKCGGSTLRQLLGDPESTGPFRSSNMLEGDISWADRFLG